MINISTIIRQSKERRGPPQRSARRGCLGNSYQSRYVIPDICWSSGQTPLVDQGAAIEGCSTPRGSCRALVLVIVLFAVVHGAASGVAAAEDRATGAPNPDTALVHTGQADLFAGLSFETSAHRGWYGVFWTGECGELPFFERLVCLKGYPTWTDVTHMVLAKAQSNARAALREKMIRLGRIIGHEWARHSDERRIDNDDLKRWSKWLKDGPDVASAVGLVSDTARRRLSHQ